MPRQCFVIMPFSTTASCTEEEWTDIFENAFKPAIEVEGLDYDCRRSAATRGNLVAAIMRDLKDAYVVVADLTDENPNVFYEIGYAHALERPTILISRRGESIPFDLQSINHIFYETIVELRDRLEKRLKETICRHTLRA